jgi:hypothetical protein
MRKPDPRDAARRRSAWLLAACLGLAAAAAVPSRAVPAPLRAAPAERELAHPYLQPAAEESFAQKRERYETKARQELDEWQQRVADLNAKAKAKGSELSEKGRAKLDAAWADTKAQWSKLKAASGDAWEGARARYERAKQRLASSWDELTKKD